MSILLNERIWNKSQIWNLNEFSFKKMINYFGKHEHVPTPFQQDFINFHEIMRTDYEWKIFF